MVLVANALDVCEARSVAHPRIRIDLEAREDGVILSVEDNAGGIRLSPPERVFHAPGSPTSPEHMGLGLGLARRLTEAVLHGELRVANTAVGARFSVQLPQAG